MAPLSSIQPPLRLFAVLLCLAAVEASAAGPVTVRIAAGSPSGRYHQLSQELAARLPEICSECRVEVLETGGSYDNARLLEEGEADVALVQSDVAYFENFRTSSFVALASLDSEALHIVARRELELEKLADLLETPRRWRVSVGEPGSGTTAHARLLLREITLAADRLQIVHSSPAEAIQALERRELDLLFLTTGVGNEDLRRAAERSIVSLLEIDSDILRDVRAQYPFFVLSEVPYGSYAGMRRNVRTLATRTLLVARRQMSGELVQALLAAVYSLPGYEEGEGLRELSIPPHPASVAFHQDRSPGWRARWRLVRPYLLPVFVLLLPLVLFLQLPKVTSFFHQFDLARILVTLLAVWLMGAAAMYLIEGQKNSSFRSFGDSAIAILHYLFSGMESKYPFTLAGNILAIAILTLGVAIATYFTATLVKLLVARALNILTLKPKPSFLFRLKDHVVLFGWSERIERIIRQLRSSDLDDRPPILVVTESLAETRLESNRDIRDVWAVEGVLTSSRTLAQAALTSARCLVIPQRSTDEGCGVVATALAARRSAEDTRLIVEAQTREAFEHLQLPALRADTVVNAIDLADRLLGQAILVPGVLSVYDELLRFGRGSQEIYLVPLPEILDGMTYRDAVQSLADRSALCLGFQVAGEAHVNPRRKSTVLRAERGDRLVVIADQASVLTEKRRRRWWPRSRRKSHGDEMTTRTTTRAIAHRNGDVCRIGICGWNAEARAILEQLHDPVVQHEFLVTILTPPGSGPENGRESTLYENVSFVFGDATQRRVLQNAGIASMETLVILADAKTEEARRYVDHRSLITALAARDVSPDVRIVAEVVDPTHQEHFQRIPGVEIVSVQNLAEKILAQAVMSPGITGIFMDLLTASRDSNEIYLIPVPERWHGKTFQELYLERADSDQVVVLGYETPAPDGGGVVQILNPSQERQERSGVVDWRGYELAAEDRLIVIAYEEPQWRQEPAQSTSSSAATSRSTSSAVL